MTDQMGNQPAYGPAYSETQTAVVPDEAKNMSAMCHALGFFWIFGPLLLIGIPLHFVLHITNFVLVIKATLAASRGEVYRYPIAMKFIS